MRGKANHRGNPLFSVIPGEKARDVSLDFFLPRLFGRSRDVSPADPPPRLDQDIKKKVWRGLPMQRCLAQTQQLMQMIPVKAGAGVCLAARCNVGVACDARTGGMGLLNDPTQLGQPL